MRFAAIVPACLALASASLLLAPDVLLAFSKSGRFLSAETNRDLRVLNNFQDAQASDNTTPDPNFPGAVGATLAIWKAATEWGSQPFGDGSGDPTQPVLGDGGANFDFYFVGLADGPGGTADKIVSAGNGGQCAGGVLSYVELDAGGGWRIVLCDTFLWDDGPGESSPGAFDIQGLITRELGFTLGLASSTFPGATMYPVLSGPSTALRSIEADDIAGVQCVYGARSASKPEINGASFDFGTGLLTISGASFGATGNEIWFTHAQPSTAGSDAKLSVTGVASSAGGTLLTLAPPAEAGSGNVMVKLSGAGFETLSNAFPLDLDPPPILASCSSANGSNVNPDVFACLTTPILGTSWTGQVDGTGIGANGFSFAFGFARPLAPIPTSFGELLVDPTSDAVVQSVASFSASVATHVERVPSDTALEGLAFSMQVFLPSVSTLTNRLDLVVGSF